MKTRIYQDAGQTTAYWIFGEIPPPWRVITAGADYWLCWKPVTPTA